MLTAKEEVPKKIQIAHSKMQIPTANQNAHSKTKSPQQNEKSTAKENHDPQHQDEAGQVAWLQLPRSRSARLGLARFFRIADQCWCIASTVVRLCPKIRTFVPVVDEVSVFFGL